MRLRSGAKQRHDLASDRGGLVGRNGPGGQRRIVGRDPELVARVPPRIELQSGPSKRLADPTTHFGGLLSDSSGEDHRLGTLQGREVCTHALAQPVAEEVQRQLGRLVGAAQQLPHVPRAGERHQPGLSVEHALEVVEAPPLPEEVGEDAGIQIAGPGAHDQAFERRVPHGRVHRLSPLDGRCGAPAAEVERNDGRLSGPAQLGVALHDASVRPPVESIAPDPGNVGDGVPPCARRQSVVKGGVQRSDEENSRTQRRLDPLERRAVVQRGNRAQLPQEGQHAAVDSNQIRQPTATMHDAMRDHLGARGKRRERPVQDRPIGSVDLDRFGRNHGEGPRKCLEQLQLHGRAAAIDHQHVHPPTSGWCASWLRRDLRRPNLGLVTSYTEFHLAER